MHAESFISLVRYAPIWVHLSVYFITCLIASIFFFFEYRHVLIFAEYFSGAIVPTGYSFEQKTVLWMLLLGAPTMLALGFFSAMRFRAGRLSALFQNMAGGSVSENSIWLPVMLFAVAASVGAYDLSRGGAFSNISVWTDYGAWVGGRWMLFSTLGYFSFVNLYLLLPVSAAWVIVNVPWSGWKALAVRLIPLVITIVLTLLLFQKKALITSLIIIFGVVLLHRILSGAWTRRLTLLCVAVVAFLAAIYFSMVVLPIYSDASRTAVEALNKQENGGGRHKPCEKKGTPEEMRKLCEEVVSYIGDARSAHVISYVLLAPMTRTSLPAMNYPIVFPSLHSYYGLDWGQDILGFGGMPDDNLVIWKHMYPNLPGGSAGAPFQFALYSQVGVVWTMLLCGLLGVVLGAMWRGILISGTSITVRSLWGAVLLLFSIYLAIDSIRNSLLSSYGVIWPLLIISLSSFICHLFKSRQEFEHHS